MKFLRSTDPRFHLVDIKVRVFVLVALFGSALVFGFVGWRQDFFTPSASYFLLPESSQNLQEGVMVKLRGFRVGKVSDVSLGEDGQVRAKISIYRKYTQHVRADSVARLRSEGVIGDYVIDLSGGLPGSPPAVEGGTLPFEREQSFAEVSESLRAEMKPALVELRKVLNWIDDPSSDVRQTLANLQKASCTLATELPETMASARESALHSHQLFDYALDPQGDFKLALRNLQQATNDLNAHLPGIMDKTATSVARLEKTIVTLQKTVEESAPKVPRMIDRGTHAAEGASEVVDVLKGMWPIRSGVNKRREEPLTVRGVK
jgi:phospholipid/cholesterol/gamma-HCH transport system substrate-binding protein